jgi:hypothetical protein
MNIAVVTELSNLINRTLPPCATMVKNHYFPPGATRVLVYPDPRTVEVNEAFHTAHSA